MKNHINRFVFTAAVIAAAFVFVFQAQPQRALADYDYINISDPFIKKIPIAVSDFVGLGSDERETEIAKNGQKELQDALLFTGYFKLIDRAAFLQKPGKHGITAADINFKNWSDIGAELLVTGGVRIKGPVLQMELRLFDPFSGQLLLGKRYTGSLEDRRKMVLRFCSQMIFRLTGKKGVFNSRIAFVSAQSGHKAIFVCDFDGKNIKPVTPSSGINLFPAWSNDGRFLAYTSYKNGKPDIFIRDMKNGSERVISFKGMNIAPAWRPGSDMLAATLSFAGDEDIYLLTGSGKIVKRLTKSWGIDVSPSFSPDGGRMAFVSNRSGSPQVFIMDLKSLTVTRLTYDGQYNTQPDWSPAGDVIAYSCMKNGHTDIYTISLKTGKVTQLTHDAGNNESPSFSPDGSLIVFSSTRGGKRSLYVMTASGTDQRELLHMPGDQSLPSWSPETGF